MVAIGFTNMLGSFLGAYPSTGSFSRTAVNSKAGVRTPAGGLVSGLVVLLAIYVLTGGLFYIPSATLSAVIIHAVGDLITPPNMIYQFWRISPVEVFVFFVGVFVSVFSDIEDGLYATVGLSGGLFLYRILKARGRFLGKVRVHSVLGDDVVGHDSGKPVGEYEMFGEPVDDVARNIFLPLDHEDGSNPEIEIDHPYPGVFIYRLVDGFSYPNANSSLDQLTEFVMARTRRTSPEKFERVGDRPWSNPGPRMTSKPVQNPDADDMPTLKAIILDFGSVHNVDVTSVQRLIDARNQLDLYTAPELVDWHIACINHRWTKRALVSGGFGVPTRAGDGPRQRWRSIFSVAEIGGASLAVDDEADGQRASGPLPLVDEETARGSRGSKSPDFPAGVDGARADENSTEKCSKRRKGVAVYSPDTPLFHVDLTSAVQSAIANVEARQEFREAECGRASS